MNYDDLEQLLKDRDSALLSLDKTKIEAYMDKYDIKFSNDPEVFWRAVHKARTAVRSFSQEEKDISEKWLKEHNSESWADKNNA